METEVSYNTFISCKGRKRKTKPALKKKHRRISSKIVQPFEELSSVVSSGKKMTQLRIRTRRQRKKRLNLNVKKCSLEDIFSEAVFESEGKEVSEPSTNRVFNNTVDLCDENSNEMCEVKVSELTAERTSECKVPNEHKSKTEQKEVIDLTENSVLFNNSELTVIDLSEEEERKNEMSCKKEANDEILVIGTFSKTSKPSRRKKTSSALNYIPLSSNSNKLNSLRNLSARVRKNSLKKNNKISKSDTNENCVREVFSDIVVTNSKSAEVGDNVYFSSPTSLPENGLRPIIIDGSNVAFVHTNSHHFCCKRLENCIKYFKERGHKVTAFVPQFRLYKNDNPQLLKALEREGDVILTPSKKVDGVQIVPYDDRFIVQTAVLKGGVIVSRDNYNDLLKENPAWAETIKYRTLAFTWVDDVLIFPKDPLGEYGPTLEEFLRF